MCQCLANLLAIRENEYFLERVMQGARRRIAYKNHQTRSMAWRVMQRNALGNLQTVSIDWNPVAK